MLVTKTAKTVTNISKLSPAHFVSNIRHQHRCSRQGSRPKWTVQRCDSGPSTFNYLTKTSLKFLSFPPFIISLWDRPVWYMSHKKYNMTFIFSRCDRPLRPKTIYLNFDPRTELRWVLWSSHKPFCNYGLENTHISWNSS